MARSSLALIVLIGCGGGGDADVFCGTLTHDRDMWFQGGLLADPFSTELCVAHDDGASRIVAAPESGECVFDGSEPDGSCYFASSSFQSWFHTVEPATLEVERSETDGSLSIAGDGWASDWNGVSVLYGLGPFTFEGSYDPVATPAQVEAFELPECDIPTCQEGTWTLAAWSGPADCEQLIERTEGGARKAVVEAEDSRLYFDDSADWHRAHRDTSECAWRYAFDGDAFNVWTHALTDGLETAIQVEKWTSTGGQAIVCQMEWEAELSPC